MTLPFSILYQPDSRELIEKDIKSTIAYREINAVMILIAWLYNNKKCKNAVIWDICHQNFDESQTISEEIDIKRIKVDKTLTLTEFTTYIREIFIRCKRLYYQVNKIPDIDFYLDNYVKVLSYLRNENTELT